MKKGNIIFYIPDGIIRSSGVLKSQILNQARFLSKQGFKCLIVASDINEEMAMITKNMIEGANGIQACVFDSCSNKVPFFSKSILSRKIYWEFEGRIKDFKPTHIYTRSVIAFGSASRIARKHYIKHIHDVRGIVSAEALVQHNWIRRRLYSVGFHLMETGAINKVEKLSCVSYRMGSWIESNSGRSDYTVIPCCVSDINNSLDMDERKRIRERLGYSQKCKVICYVGSCFAKWQRIRSIISLCRGVSLINPWYRFLFVTPNTSILKNMIKDIGLDLSRCYITSCGQADVKNYLKACDAGIIMRNDILINNVACPIKIGEYLNGGLPVLLTKNIGDMSELIDTDNVGLVMKENNHTAAQVVEYLNNIQYEEMYAKCKHFVSRHLSWNAYIKEFEELYR